MATISVMSSGGSPTDVSTITMVTRPACGIPAAPILAAVAVILEGNKDNNIDMIEHPMSLDRAANVIDHQGPFTLCLKTARMSTVNGERSKVSQEALLKVK